MGSGGVKLASYPGRCLPLLRPWTRVTIFTDSSHNVVTRDSSRVIFTDSIVLLKQAVNIDRNKN